MMLAGLLLATGPADAATTPRAIRPQASPAVATPAPSPASQAAALAQMTGLTPGQVTSRATCAAPSPGQATCDAHVVVLRSNGALVRPRLHAQQALADVQPAPPPGRRPAPIQPPGSVGGASAADVTTTGLAAPAAGTPAWLQQAYDLSYLSANQGAGETIAVVDAYDDPTAGSDLAVFRAAYGLPACTTANGCFRKVNEYGTSSRMPASDSGWAAEDALDLDAVSSLCPKCNIILVEARSANPSDLATAMRTAAQTLGATQISASWTIVSDTPLTETLTWPGVATVAANGDYGYNDHLSAPGDVYPAAAPGVTAVGGTTLAAAGGPRGYGESAWSNTGSGCDTAEAKPSYQTDIGCGGRAYADVSADADPTTGLSVYDTGSGGWVLMGGTSLATPMVAAFDAVTGVPGSTPQWAYNDSALLNDPASGSNGVGLCAASIFYICNAGTGYDGPTGVGSISGQVASGGPGIGGPTQSNGSSYVQSVTQTSATLAGGVYPNGNDTTYWWEYGPTTAYGQQTTATDIGSGTTPAAASITLAGLLPSTTYHYRLVASNADGTTYGYDYTLTTASSSASPQQTATDSSTTTQSQSTTTPSSAPSNPPGVTTPVITTTSTTPVQTTPQTTTPAPTTTSGTTAPLPPVATSPAAGTSRVRAAAPVIAVRPRLGGAALVGARLRVMGGAYRNGTVTAVRFERCARTCVAAGRGMAHTPTAADAGYYLRAWVTVSGAGGTVSTWAIGTIGPIRSKTAGIAPVRPGAATVRGSAGRVLARVTTRGSRARGATTTAVERARVSAVGGAVRVWACVSAGAAPSCTAPLMVHGVARFSLALRSGQRAVLIAVAHG